MLIKMVNDWDIKNVDRLDIVTKLFKEGLENSESAHEIFTSILDPVNDTCHYEGMTASEQRLLTEYSITARAGFITLCKLLVKPLA